MAPPPQEIVLHERPRLHQRCPYCHDALEEAGAGEEIPCSSCGTLHHEVCLEELGGCTVLGCQGRKPRPLGSVEEVRARVRERLARFLENTQRPPSAGEQERVAREGAQGRNQGPVRRKATLLRAPRPDFSAFQGQDWLGLLLLGVGVFVIIGFVLVG